MQNTEYRMQNAECIMHNVGSPADLICIGFAKQLAMSDNAEYRMQNTECRMQNAECIISEVLRT